MPNKDPPALSARFGCPQLPPVIGHRGAAARAPENTLAGLRCAKALGCTWVEFDVRLTGDGVPVLCHDPRLGRTSDGSGWVSGRTLAQIKACDAGRWFAPEFAGERMPTLDDALLTAAELDLGVDIELKGDYRGQYALAAAVAASLQQLEGGLPALLVSSFQPAVLGALRQLVPRIARAILFRSVPRNWAQLATRLGCAVIGADHRRLRRSEVAEICAAGCRLAAYTVNDPIRARMLFDWGVTSVFTDVPDIILQGSADHVAARSGAAAPPGCDMARSGAVR